MLGSSNSSLLPTFQEEPACAGLCPNLSYKQRLIGFVGCATLGYFLSIIGSLTLIGGFSDTNIRTFIILYVCGNVIALSATGFLIGPKRQCIKMWDPTRRYSTAFFLATLIVVFAVAVTKQNIVLILFLLFVEILAATWYSLSYVPFGRKIALTCLRKIYICAPCFFISDSIHDATAKKQSNPLSNILGSGDSK